MSNKRRKERRGEGKRRGKGKRRGEGKRRGREWEGKGEQAVDGSGIKCKNFS